MLYWFYWCLSVGAGLFLVDRLFLWFESQGWINWRKRSSSGAGNAFVAMDAAFQPGKRYVLEQKQEEQKERSEEEDEAGDKKP